MELYILRHAIAVDRADGLNDFDRPLTPEGEEKLRRVTKAMRTLGLTFDAILSSPYVRARETAEQVAAGLGLAKVLQLADSLGADSNPRDFIAHLRTIRPAPSQVLLVGHEPFLSTLVSLLLAGSNESFVTMKKAGLCKLEVNELRVGRCARLEWLLSPRQMLLMS